jgi:DNA-binding NarL/FixJ family response regulator
MDFSFCSSFLIVVLLHGMQLEQSAIRNVLLIDDDVDDFLIFEAAVKEVDPTIRVMHIAALADVPQDEHPVIPDMLFLDINMPDQDGFEWLKCIREKGYTFPIVMYSTASNPSYVAKAYEEGANVYFPKPSSYKNLHQSLTRLLQMNWEEPQQVREIFCRDGKYRVFTSV